MQNLQNQFFNLEIFFVSLRFDEIFVHLFNINKNGINTFESKRYYLTSKCSFSSLLP